MKEPGRGATFKKNIYHSPIKDIRLPLQITIPAQPGNPTSQPRQLTVQVPAHALQQSGQTAAILQNVLTQAHWHTVDVDNFRKIYLLALLTKYLGSVA